MIPILNLMREERCGCGHLLAVLCREGVEIKCRRCKRMHTLTLKQIAQILKDQEPLSSDPTGQPA